jgi:hypothetical protein
MGHFIVGGEESDGDSSLRIREERYEYQWGHREDAARPDTVRTAPHVTVPRVDIKAVLSVNIIGISAN